ncbi:hypothetical protein PA598K_00174 [Paenibacillus sp. 598K]|nr:hypothetical protein PA598K_00174 [Paenibacillus sp. 598K]
MSFAKINDILEQWASFNPPLRDFTVDSVLNAINFESTYDYVFRFLNSKDGFEIELSRIYLCPNSHKAFHCSVDEEIDDYDLPTCHICGEEIMNDLDYSYLVFNFTDSYVQGVKKKRQMQQSLILR